MNNLSENLISSVGLSNIKRRRFEGLLHDICIADYLYEKNGTVIARYVLIECTYQEFQNVFCRDSNFYEDVIQVVFFECFNTDLCWNIYQICIMSELEYGKVSKSEMLAYEADTDYTRKLLIPYTKFTSTIPVGRIKIEHKIVKWDEISPKLEWQRELERRGLGFCGEEYVEKQLEEYIKTGKYTQVLDENRNLYKKNNINNIVSIFIPNSFRKNCFVREERLEFGKVNMISGKNGSGKTSILEGIELVITGTVRKAMGIYKYYKDVPGIYCLINNGQKIKKPGDSKEILRRAKTWYHKSNKGEEKLNSDFHLYNYFMTIDTFILSYLGDKKNLGDQFFQILFGEESLNYYENMKKYLENIYSLIESSSMRLQDMNQMMKSCGNFKAEIKQAERDYFEKLKMYSGKSNENKSIEEIESCIKKCMEICQVIENVSALCLYNDVSECLLDVERIENEITELKKSLRKNKNRQIIESDSAELRGEEIKLRADLGLKTKVLPVFKKTLQSAEMINALYTEANKIIDLEGNNFQIKDIYNICYSLNESLSDWHTAQEQKNEWETKIAREQIKLDRLNFIKTQLNKLREPEYFLKKYVGNNIKQISDLFLLLQSPKEFDGLAFSQDAELVGVRGKETIPLHMMSSGQRVAAVMALFFSVHLSADCIPKIILLDEPISHIDELNILSLFDFLREMVLQYDRQLFFTTSTKEIGRLFERKFSFLKEDFKGFYFERKGIGRTEIKCKSGQ